MISLMLLCPVLLRIHSVSSHPGSLIIERMCWYKTTVIENKNSLIGGLLGLNDV